MKKYVALMLGLAVVELAAQNSISMTEVEHGNFLELGFGKEYADGALDVAGNGDRQILAGWVEGDGNGKDAGVWHSMDVYLTEDDDDYQVFIGTSGYDEVGTAVALDEEFYYLSIVKTATYDADGTTDDVGMVYKMDLNNNVVWSYTLPTIDAGTLPRDLLIDGETLYVLSQLTVLGSEDKGMMLSAIDMAAGTPVYNTPYYYPQDAQGIEVTELHTHNGELITIGNTLAGNHPVVLAANPSSGINNSNTALQDLADHYLYGFDIKANNEIMAAGHVMDDGAKTAINVQLNSGRNHDYTLYSTEENECGFRDVTVYEEGFTSVGYLIPSDSTTKDIYTVVYDANGNELKSETVGEEGDEILYSSTLVELADRTDMYSAGEYHSVGEDLGNAYLLGTRGWLSSSATCELKRAMYVDDVFEQNGTTAIFSGHLLESETTFRDMVNIADDNNISILILYDMDFLFALDDQNKLEVLERLGRYILKYKMHQNLYGLDIHDFKIVLSVGGSLTKAQNMDLYASIQDLRNEMRGLTFMRFNFLLAHQIVRHVYAYIPEHEFWNTGDPDNTRDIYDVPYSDGLGTDGRYLTMIDDHMVLLDELANIKNQRPSITHIFDYVGHLHNTGGNATSATDKTNTVNMQNVANDIVQRTGGDGLFLTYYQSHPTGNNGTNFYWADHAPPVSVNHDDDWTKRLLYFGQNTSGMTNILPLFSVEFDNHTVGGASLDCYKKDPITYLGKYLFNGSTSSQTLSQVESYWIDGGASGQAPISFPNIYCGYEEFYGGTSSYNVVSNATLLSNVEVAGFGYFTYTCFRDNAAYLSTISNAASLYDCSSMSGNYNGNFKRSETNRDDDQQENVEFSIYPNPSYSYFEVASNAKALSYRIIDLSGKTLEKGEVTNQKVEHTINTKGTYIVEVLLANGKKHVTLLLVNP